MARQPAAALTPRSPHSPPLGEEPPRPASHAPPDASSPGRDVWPRMARLPAGANPVPSPPKAHSPLLLPWSLPSASSAPGCRPGHHGTFGRVS